jgi:hypothetical protein
MTKSALAAVVTVMIARSLSRRPRAESVVLLEVRDAGPL